MSSWSIGATYEGNTITALPSGTGDYGHMFQLTRPDNSVFYSPLPAPNLIQEIPQVELSLDGTDVNASNPIPVVIEGGGGGSGSVGTTGTPNVSVLKDSTSNNEVSIDSNGRLSVLIDGTVATAVNQTSGLSQDTGGSGTLGFFSSMVANLRLIAARLLSIGGNVGGKATTVDVALTVTSGSAYASGNVVGKGNVNASGVLTGLIAFNSALLTAGTGILQSITLKASSDQSATGYALALFKSSPSASTFQDKAAPGINASDANGALIGVYPLSSGSKSLGTHTIFNNDGIGKVLNVGATTLYGVLVTTGTPTFTTTSDLVISIGVLQD